MIAIMGHAILPSLYFSKIFLLALLVCLTSALDNNDENDDKNRNLVRRDVEYGLGHQVGDFDWSNLHGVWGRRRRSIPDSWDMNTFNVPIVEKKAWQRLQGAWGKRSPYQDDDSSAQDMDEYLPVGGDAALEHEEEKRNWRKFNDGWGKRAGKWENFRGSWGKRDPAWSNLKGIWGKRSNLALTN